MSGARLGRWVTRHRTVGPIVHSIFERTWLRGPHRYRAHEHGCFVCRAVWAADYDDDPGLRERLLKSIANMDAGRWYSVDTKTGISTPNPDWPKDGEQPR